MEAKFKLTNEKNVVGNNVFYRIEALKDFADVRKGDRGGFLETEFNLSQFGDAWVYDDALVYGDARVFDTARVYGNGRVYDNAWVSG
ncbi:MAG: hypothetical protein UIQ67_06025, partial [Bacteroidales bacterium]|nr:hypothetical protein [Bacteroidales bacterium]